MGNEYAVGPGRFWQEMREERALAESVACPYCGAAVGETCVNPVDDAPLRRLPAHLARLRAAGVSV